MGSASSEGFYAIILLGPKHAGKSSAAAALAGLWGGEALDLDGLIERQTGRSCRSLYRAGPARFREAEARALEEALAPESGPRIIAAGGGIIDNREAAALLQNTRGILLVYLEVSAETAWARINASGDLPPFLDTADPRDAHRKLHERRGRAYQAMAHITVSGEAGSPEQTALDIYHKLRSPPPAEGL
jgi:shikimate kinase